MSDLNYLIILGAFHFSIPDLGASKHIWKGGVASKHTDKYYHFDNINKYRKGGFSPRSI